MEKTKTNQLQKILNKIVGKNFIDYEIDSNEVNQIQKERDSK
jgi:hypothetical protein